MCELLGISSNMQTNLRYSMQAMETHSRIHRDGWGAAYYPEGSRQCVVFKEGISLFDSDLARFLNRSDKIRSKIIINHIRYSTTTKAYDNTHPFSRELFGQQWAMIHNGAHGLDSYFENYLEEHDNKIDFIPFGTTGSDKAFCIILNELKRNIETNISLEYDEGRVSTSCVYSFEKAQKLIYDECIKIMNSGANFNMMLSNGEYLIAFHSGYNHLHYVYRDGRSIRNSHIRLKDQDFESIGLEKEPDERAVIVATEELTEGEDWKKLLRGESLIFKDGVLVFRNGAPAEASGRSIGDLPKVIEVYDSPSWLDNKRDDYKVIGMPLVLRKALGVELGDKVIVSNRLNKIKLEVCKTDRRLLKGGSCEADNPDFHVCIPRSIRRALGIYILVSNRNHLECFRKKFTPVSIENNGSHL